MVKYGDLRIKQFSVKCFKLLVIGLGTPNSYMEDRKWNCHSFMSAAC